MRISRPTTRFLASTVVAATAVLGPMTASANAATLANSSCAYGVAATKSIAVHAPVTKTCFATFSQALRFATAGRVNIPRSATSVSAGTLAAAGAIGPNTTNPLLGIEYQDINYGGGGDVYYGSTGTGCSSGVTYGFTTVQRDNTYSSARGYSGCGSTQYQYTYYGGAQYPCTPNCSSLGLLNDKTSSIVYRP